MKAPALPWCSGNAFALQIDGPTFFPAMLADIAAARQRLALELYLVEDGDCCEQVLLALCAAAARGVRVQCLFDAFGSRRFSQRNRQRLRAAGVQVRLYNPLDWRRGLGNLYRDHRKLLLVDQRCGYIGGSGLGDAFWRPGEAQADWHELMLRFGGPVLEQAWHLFESQWQGCSGRCHWQAVLPLAVPLAAHGGGFRRAGLARLAYASAGQQRDILQSLLLQIDNARARVWLATPYFLPGPRVRRALLRAARRGVDVRLLLTGSNTDHPPVRFAGQRHYPKLLRAGVRIFEYQPRFLHLKMVRVDDWSSIGSCNFDRWGLRFNLEANLEVIDAGLGRQLDQCFVDDFALSSEVTLADWHARPWHKRLRQRLWAGLDRLAIRLLDRRH